MANFIPMIVVHFISHFILVFEPNFIPVIVTNFMPEIMAHFIPVIVACFAEQTTVYPPKIICHINVYCLQGLLDIQFPGTFP